MPFEESMFNALLEKESLLITTSFIIIAGLILIFLICASTYNNLLFLVCSALGMLA
jgi:hypothetical protein